MRKGSVFLRKMHRLIMVVTQFCSSKCSSKHLVLGLEPKIMVLDIKMILSR